MADAAGERLTYDQAFNLDTPGRSGRRDWCVFLYQEPAGEIHHSNTDSHR
jgi:hypothetical protein